MSSTKKKHDPGRMQKPKKRHGLILGNIRPVAANYDQATLDAHQIMEHSPSLEKTVNELHSENRKLVLDEAEAANKIADGE